MSTCLRSVSAFVAFASLVFCLSEIATASDPARREFSHPLFDGKTLNGWTAENGCEAEVKDGMLLLKAGNGWLRSDLVYTDFKLHLEWKAIQESNYDAGVYLRTPAGGKPFPKNGYQANMLEGKEGNIGNVKGAESAGLAKPAGEWNAFDFTVVGDTVETHINGKRAYKTSGIENPSGYIGIQIEVPKGGQFLLRNIRVTELTHEPLFNGVDLTGWEGAGAPAETCWKVEDGAIVCTGKKKGPWLRSTRQFGDFNLRLEYEVSPGGNSGVYVRVPENGNHHRQKESEGPAGFEVQVLDDSADKYRRLKPYQFSGSVYAIAGATEHVCRPPGEWNTLEINCKGHTVAVTHNGVQIVDATPEEFPRLKLRQTKGFLGLQNHNTVVRFRNLRLGAALDEELLIPVSGT